MHLTERKDPADELLVFRQPNARRKATHVAPEEALQLLRHLGARVEIRGPFGTQTGLFYLALPANSLNGARSLLSHLGYTESVQRVVMVGEKPRQRNAEVLRWKGKYYSLETVYEANKEQLREMAPDRREFVLPSKDGGVRRVVGYRGDSGSLSRRGLAVADCRMLVNLVYSPTAVRFLDPFGGAGGIVTEAIAHGLETFSVDLDPKVMYGLRFIGARHTVADARSLPFGNERFDAIAGEPPYEETALGAVRDALTEIDRVLKVESRVALLLSPSQLEPIAERARHINWSIELAEPIDRKGLRVHVLCCRKTSVRR
jgi:hypothetical protein